MRFSISQHTRDVSLLEGLMIFFDCGYVVKYTQRSVCEFIITKTEHLANNIIPFFNKHPIVGSKHFNYLDFKSALNIIKNNYYMILFKVFYNFMNNSN